MPKRPGTELNCGQSDLGPKCYGVKMTRAEQGKAGKYSTGHGRALEGIVERCRAVQGIAKTKRLRQVRAVQGRTRTDRADKADVLHSTEHSRAQRPS